MYLLGASGHAKVIIDSLKASGKKISGLFDDNPEVKELLGYNVFGSFDPNRLGDEELIISVGLNHIRKKIVDKLLLPGSKNTVKMGIGVQQNREQEYSKNGNKNTVISINIINQGLHCIINKKQDCDGLKNKITYHYVSRDSQAS